MPSYTQSPLSSFQSVLTPEEFSRKHAGDPRLESNPIYSISAPILKVIIKLAPGLINKDEAIFERDLAAITDGGFFHGEVFGYPLLGHQPIVDSPANVKSMIDSQESSNRAIETQRRSTLRAEGKSDVWIDRCFAKERQILEKSRTQQAAFAGWLVTNREYRSELLDLRKVWGPIIAEQKYFPCYPRSLMGEAPAPPTDVGRDEYSLYLRFLRRWSLDSFSTWELPIPMAPEFGQILYQLGQPSSLQTNNAVGLDEAGMVAFFPASVLYGKSIIDEVIKYLATYQSPSHLAEWTSKRAGKGSDKNWGCTRYRRLLEMYRYLELALRPRYGDRASWNLEKVDQVFAAVWDTKNPLSKVESARQTRRKIKYRLASE